MGAYLWRSRLDIRPSVGFNIERLDEFLLRTQEPESKEDELGREELFGARNLFHLPSATAVLRPLNANWSPED